MLEKTNARVYFSIFGDHFPIETVSTILGLKPTCSYIKGEEINEIPHLRRTKPTYRKETVWEIGTNYEETYDINDQIMQVTNLLQNKEDTIKKLCDEFKLQCLFMIVIVINEGETPATYINKEFIRLAYKLNAEIDFDIYANPYHSTFED